MFGHPLDARYPATCHYIQEGQRFDWSIDKDNGLWLPVKSYGRIGQHRGVDFSCPIGTVVRAMADGVIVRARFESALDPAIGAGLYILQLVSLLGYDSWTFRYSHLRNRFVEPGQRVQKGDAIGESGESGAVSHPYLHVDLMDLRRQWRPIPIDNE